MLPTTPRRIALLLCVALVAAGVALAVAAATFDVRSASTQQSGSVFVWRAPNPGPARRAYVLRRNGAGVEVVDAVTQRVLADHRLDGTRQVDIHGADGRDNTLTVDLGNGPIAVPGGVHWLAGARGYNTLAVRGGGGIERSFPSGPHSGRIVVGATTVDYAQIAPIIDSSPATNFTFNVPNTATNVSVTDGGPQTGCTDTMEIQATGAETEFICNKPNVTVDGSAGSLLQDITLNEASTPDGLGTLVVKGGPHGNSIDVIVSPFNVATTVDAGTRRDAVAVQTTGSGGSLLVDGQSGGDTVNVGSLGSVQGVVEQLDVQHAALNIDDHNDVVHRQVAILDNEMTGAAPAPIFYGNLTALGIALGSGSPRTIVASTPPGTATTVTSRSPASALVADTGSSGSLHLVDNAAVAVSVGDAGSAQHVRIPLSVSGTGATSLTIDDSADTTGRGWTGTATSLRGLIPGGASWTAGAVTSVVVDEGSGSDAATIVPGALTKFTVDGGPPNPPATPGDRLIVNLAGAKGRQFSVARSASGNSGSWTFSNRGAVHFSRIESPSTTGTGYFLAAANGAVFGAGGASSHGALSTTLANPVVGIAATAGGGGYWEATRNGEVRAFGDATSFGDLPTLHVNVLNIVAIAPTTDGRGYWLIGSDGGEFAFGDAHYHGSVPGLGIHVDNIVGMVASPSGTGYLLVGSDGGVFAFGAGVRFYGSLPGLHVVVHNVVGILPSPTDTGYDLVGSDGGVFAFGTGVHYFGSLPGRGIAVSNIVGLALTPDTLGYWLAGANGSVYAFGDGSTFGEPAGATANLPIAAIAGT